MANGVYLIDPDGKSGMLDDGTEFVAVLDEVRKDSTGVCTSCVGNGNVEICNALPQCYAWSDAVLRKYRVPPNKTWVYEVKE